MLYKEYNFELMATSSKGSTRSATINTIFGHPATLPSSQLPTKDEVFKCYLWYRNKAEKERRSQNTRELAKFVANDIIDIWHKASLPTIDYANVLQSLLRTIEQGKKIQKYPPARRDSEIFSQKEESFNDLFNICTCRCVQKGIIDRSNCPCPVKVPAIEWNFWLDQNTERKMIIGSLDTKVTEQLQKRHERKQKQEKFKKKYFETCESDVKVAELQVVSMEETDSDKDADEGKPLIFESAEINLDDDPDSEFCASSRQNRLQYPQLCEMMERTGISNRDACRIVNACLKDMNMNKEEFILEPRKLRRQRLFWRSKVVESRVQKLTCIKCIGFDGRIDQTRLLDAGRVARTKKEDHYVIVAYPGENYIDHVAPQTGQAKDIAAEMLSVINETASSETLTAVLCDSTNVNTGECNGVIRRLETAVNRPLQWLICMLHLNELPFREVFSKVDGATSGPRGYHGDIGKKLNFNAMSLPIVNFKAVQGWTENVSEEIKNDLSEDQRYLLRACLVVQQGKDQAAVHDLKFLASASPGSLHHARWLTCANRVLRLYMSTEAPSQNMLNIVSFIVQVYAPSWFNIRRNPLCSDGARNFFYMLRKSRSISDSLVLESTRKVLRRNCYFAHPENILLAALTDADYAIRKDAAKKVISARQNTQNDNDPRRFTKSIVAINFDATSYYEMIDWSKTAVTSPPILQFMSSEELLQAAESGPIILPMFPCHSQGVERAVKQVTRAASKVCGHAARHGMIASTEESIQKKKKLETKKDFYSV